MTKALLKKQMFEVFSWLFIDRKTGKRRENSKFIGYIVLYTVIFGWVSTVFFGMAFSMAKPLAAVNMSWFYFLIMSLLSVALSVFGSVFNTYSTLYKAKDNDLLLSMPIPTETILLTRLFSVGVMGLMYETIVYVPTLIVYFTSVKQTLLSVIFSILLYPLLAVFNLVLTSILGYVVALISEKLKNQKILTVIIALVFFGVYYYMSMNFNKLVEKIVAAPEAIASKVKGPLYLFYLIGKSAEGNILATVEFTAVVAVLLLLVYFVMKRSFLKLATSNKGTKKKVYIEKKAEKASINKALFNKELRRFLGSSSYMLNCGFGIPVFIIGAIIVLIKRTAVITALTQVPEQIKSILPLILTVAVCLVTSMCDISAPSISLEGKTLWQLQVLPVDAYSVLKAKRNLHFILTAVPALILTASLLSTQTLSVFYILTPVTVLAYIWFSANFGLILNLKMPNFNWTNEIIPIKQSSSVLIAVFGSWGISLVLAGLGYGFYKLFGDAVSSGTALCILIIFASLYSERWMKTKGSEIFKSL